ncbi:hypothetical protein, partial [Klebsiella pneumoniae]
GCSDHVSESPQSEKPLVLSEKYHPALGWLLTVQYDNVSLFDKSMAIATDFCKSKGKMATLYKSNFGDGAQGTIEVWACQTPPALDDTDVMIGVYCNFISIAPRYTVDLSNKQKKRAEYIYTNTLIKKGIEYPVGGISEKYRNSYISWVVSKSKESTKLDPVLTWFKKNCK